MFLHLVQLKTLAFLNSVLYLGSSSFLYFGHEKPQGFLPTETAEKNSVRTSMKEAKVNVNCIQADDQHKDFQIFNF